MRRGNRSGNPARRRGARFREQAVSFRQLAPRHRTYEVKLLSTWMGTPSGAPAPRTVTVLDWGSDDPRLFVGPLEIGPDRWRWEERSRTLSWHEGSGGGERMGHLVFDEGEVRGTGTIRVGGAYLSVVLDLKPVSYTCALAANAGAYATGGAEGVTLNWDSGSQQWQQATWVPAALRFTYGLLGKVFIGQKTYEDVVGFEDLDLQRQWSPPEGGFSALVDSDLVYVFATADGVSPEADDRSQLPEPRREIATVFPYSITVQFDPFGQTFEGAMLTGADTIDGQVYAVRGTADSPAAVGHYRLELEGGGERTIAIDGGKLLVDGRVHEASGLRGTELHWRDLPDSLGLPAAGRIALSDDGARVLAGDGVEGGRRVSPAEASPPPGEEPLQPGELLNMTQFVEEQGGWIDQFQKPAMEDFYAVLQHYMEPSLREEFVAPNPPDLEPELAQIAATQGADGTAPGPWYESLSVAYLTKALAGEKDNYAAKLNKDRALKKLNEQVASAPVYQAQAPEMYARRWLMHYPQMANFLAAQDENPASYQADIKQDAIAWRSEVEATVEGQEQVQKMLETIATVERLGLESRFWAYWMFRACTQPPALMLLEMLSISGSLDGTAYSRRIQSNVAVLNLLDPSAEFVHEYLRVIQLFQIYNVLPSLLDYSGDVDEYVYPVEKVLEAFIAEHAGSTDPKVQEAVAAAHQALEAKLVQRILQAFANTASVFAGVYGWEQLAQKFLQDLPSVLGQVPVLAAQLVTMAAASCGVMAFIFGVESWSRLNDRERAALVVGASALFIQIAAALVRRGVAYATIFCTESSAWEALKTIVSSNVLDVAGSRLTTGFARWLVVSGDSPPVVESEMFGNLFAEEAARAESLTVKGLGPNLDVLIATRLGAMFAVVNIVLSSLALAGSKDEMEKIANSLFLAAGALELIATAGSWVLGSFGIEAIGGLAIATIASCLTALAAFVAIAGLILMIVLMTRKQKSPIQKFAEGPASAAGLYMPEEAEIDSFQAYAVAGQPQRLGVAMLAGGDPSTALVLASRTPAIGAVTSNFDTCLQLVTDALGRARIGTIVTEGTAQVSMLLGCEDGKTLLGAPVIAEAKRAPQQQWFAQLIGGVTHEGVNLKAAIFKLYNAYWYEQSQTKLYLEQDSGGVGVGPTGTEWLLEMRPMQPQGLTMAKVRIYTDQRNQSFMPYLPQPGSEPRQWKLEPPLPEFLGFDPASGAVEQLPGVAPQLTAPTQFTTSVVNALGTESTSFGLEVVERPPAAVAPT